MKALFILWILLATNPTAIGVYENEAKCQAAAKLVEPRMHNRPHCHPTEFLPWPMMYVPDARETP